MREKETPGLAGGPAGDLYITIRVEEHPFFKRDGDNIAIQVPLTVSEAGLGAKIEVPTIDGRALLKIPQGTQNGQKFRLREKGVLNARKNNAATKSWKWCCEHRTFRMSVRVNCCESWRKCKPKTSVKRCGVRCKDIGGDSMAKGKSRAAYMISAVAERYEIHPQTLRLYEREGLLAPSRSDGNTRLYTDEDLERLEVILKLTRELGVNLAGVEIILNMREKMEAMQRQMESFVANLNHEFSQHAGQFKAEDKNSLIPVIQINALSTTANRTASRGERAEGREGRRRYGR